MILHWLNIHIWVPMWPNMFAPSVFTLFGVTISHIKLKRHHAKMAQSIHEHLDRKGPDG